MTQKIAFGLLFCLLALSAFAFPRALVAFLGESHFLSSYLYIYGQGLPFFILGVYMLLKTKAINTKRVGEKRWLLYFVLVLVWNVLFHGLWIWTAVQAPSLT